MRYLRVLGSALLCYAALGAVLRILPPYLGHDLAADPAIVGLAVGAPALTGVVTRPLGGRLADRRGPAPILTTGAVAMTAGILPAFDATVVAQLASRLLVGAGEGLMMAAAVLWLLRLSGPERQGRALGHIGLANYGGLALGPLIADAIGGEQHPSRVFVAAAVLPLAAVAVASTAGAPEPAAHDPVSASGLRKAILLPGIGLMLVNVGYVALLSFPHGGLVVPTFAAMVILVRTAGGAIPDRFGARRTLAAAAPLEAAGLALSAIVASTPEALVAAAAAAAGQALAVPALGLLALERVSPARQGTAAGVFFSFFDAGVGLGGVTIGALAHLGGPSGALLGAAAAVAAVTALSANLRQVEPFGPLVD